MGFKQRKPVAEMLEHMICCNADSVKATAVGDDVHVEGRVGHMWREVVYGPSGEVLNDSDWIEGEFMSLEELVDSLAVLPCP